MIPDIPVHVQNNNVRNRLDNMYIVGNPVIQITILPRILLLKYLFRNIAVYDALCQPGYFQSPEIDIDIDPVDGIGHLTLFIVRNHVQGIFI